MPQKSKTKSSPNAPPKLKRGRPRKITAPDALLPFGTHEVTSAEKFKRLEKKWKTAEKKPASRRMSPLTSDKNYSSDEVEFMNALDEFKRASGRMFPTCTEILGVLRGLGYEKVIEKRGAEEILP